MTPVGTGNEVQVVTITGAPTGGTFTLTYAGQTTAGIAFDADAATVDAALEALSNIGAGDVAVTGSAGGPYTVTFQGALKNTNVAQMTASGAGLTGGSSPAVGVATSTAGNPPIPAGEVAVTDDPKEGPNTKEWLPGQTPDAGSTLIDKDGA